jgi:signal transduction histidine kinase/CheY-like chemotaxis protein/HAMP domain-containing protein
MSKMNFNNIKIRTKLLLGFSAICVMVIALGWLAFFQSSSIWQNTRDLYNHPFKVNIAVREIQTGITAMHRSLKDVVLSDNQYSMNKYLNLIALDENEVYKNFQIVYDLYLGSRSTIDSAYTVFTNWKGIRDTTILLCQEGKVKEAEYRTTHAAESYNNQMMAAVKRLSDFAMQKANDFYSSVEHSKNQLLLQLWLVIGLIFILISIIAYTIMQAIAKPLRLLMVATESQQKGDYSARCQMESASELGQLAASFNQMAASIESEIRIKTGITEISDSMLGKDDFNDFGKSLLGTIMAHTNSIIGAIYILNEESAEYEPKFTVGMQNDKMKNFSATNFEGEFGRTLLEKNITLVKSIPNDSLFDFQTVTGTFKPREILNIPILQNKEVIAIISLANLVGYDSEIMEMLKVAEKNLVAGLSSILAFQKIREYSQMLDQQNTELGFQSKELRLQKEELHEQNAELEMQKRQIDEASRLKSDFLSSMSHELRTPLNAVIALSGVLSRKLKAKIPDDEYSYLEIIERNGKNLLTLINEILDLSRIEAGKTDIQLSKFSLKEAVNTIIDTLQVQIQQKNIIADNLIDPDFPLIFTDRTKCHHILQNLIGNAVKFTDHGSVWISAEQFENEVHVLVKDTGIGISQDQLPHIFSQFHQVDGSASRKHEGTGLGLAIADKYSRLLGARITVKSELGQGSVFTLILPIVDSERGAMANAGYLETSAHDTQSGGTRGNLRGFGKTILIIEDSEPAIIQLSEILTENGYLIEIARSGIEALKKVKVKIPDAIILDLMMPEMDGFEVLENIRGTQATAMIPVLILTAKYLSKDELKQLTANNIHQLIQKGDVGKDELLSHVRSMLDSTIKVDKVIPKKAVPVSKKGELTILLVEDNEDNVKTVQVLLANRYNLIIARDGVEGVLKATSMHPDLILLDISLPIKDGFMVLDEIRNDESLVGVPVIAVTARAMKGDKDHFLNYGFDDYLSKPIDSVVFEETLNKWILA